jgi:hypothetical protein
MRTIKLFIASSYELKEDRDHFRMFISQENDRLHTKGLYLEIIQWENFLDSISDSRLQDEYNNAIRQCDIVLCLFFTKVGKYTAEEFDTAYQVFKDEGKPYIWTYFKNAPITTGSITQEINTLLEFKKKIASLGHFYTEYTSIDNLINKYRTQLDKFLPKFETGQQENSATPSPTEIKVPVKNTFNQLLTKQLIEAIKPHNKKATDFLTSTTNWESNPHLVQTAKRIIISGYVGALGVQLRKLMSIGEEDFSKSKVKRYLENCHLTVKRALQLVTYALISTLWDHQQKGEVKLSATETDALAKFFKNASEASIPKFTQLLKILIAVFSENKLELPIPELAGFTPDLLEKSPFTQSCHYLQTVSETLNEGSFEEKDCYESEKNVALIFEKLNFLAEYRMISIKDIDYDQQRNDSVGLYLHNYTLLEGDSQSNNTSQGKIRKETSPLISYAVLLFKGNLRQYINMVPFIIDYNGMALSGGSKICFYSYCNTFDDLSLNFNFVEDNVQVTVKKSNNPKPDDKEPLALNSWLANPENRKDMNFDHVFHLFHEAKRALTGIEEETHEDSF